jgi:hypothetical protein
LLLVVVVALAPAAAFAQAKPDTTKKPAPTDSVKLSFPADTSRAKSAIPTDSLLAPIDSAIADSLKKKPARDSIKTPTARPYTPHSTEIGANGSHWTRDQMFESGAFTLGELLSRVSGVTMFQTGFILAPQVAGFYGDPSKVRLFLDGIEMDAINVRNGGISDLAMTPLWLLEDVQVERTASELRVHMRSWRVDRTSASTRADIMTGSENLNLYRGWYGKRFDNGGVLQLGGQQHSTVSAGGMDGDALGGFARIGWARGNWSVDGTFIRQGANRNSGARFLAATPQKDVMPPFQGSEGLTYLRFAWRDPQIDGPWVQIIAAAISQGESSSSSASTGLAATTTTTAKTDSVDTLAFRSQYTVAAGITRWGVRLSTTNRLRSVRGKAIFAPGARAEYDWRKFNFSAYAEQGVDSTLRTDANVRVAPFSWFNVGAAVSRTSPKNLASGLTFNSTRLEGAVHWRDRWISGGIVTEGARTLAAPIELDTVLKAVTTPAATGAIFSLRGPIGRGWQLDLDLIRWSTAGPYRPQMQTRTRLFFESGFLGRFPRNNFHLLVSGTHEYRTATYVPLGANSIGQTTPGASVLSTLLEIRIATAVISWQYRNAFGTIYETYPGYVMPRLTNIYGLRWEFWN